MENHIPRGGDEGLETFRFAGSGDPVVPFQQIPVGLLDARNHLRGPSSRNILQSGQPFEGLVDLQVDEIQGGAFVPYHPAGGKSFQHVVEQGVVPMFALPDCHEGLLPLGDVHVGPHQAQRFALIVLEEEAPRQDVDVVALLVAHPELHVVSGGATPQEISQPGPDRLQVVRVQQAFPRLVAVFQLTVPVPEDRFPARGEVDFVGCQVPVPETVVGPPHGQLEAFLAGLERLLGLPAGATLRHVLQAALNGGNQAGQPVLDDEVPYPHLEQVRRLFLAEASRDQNHRQLGIAGLDKGETLLEAEARDAVVGEDDVPCSLGQGTFQLPDAVHSPAASLQPLLPQVALQHPIVGLGVLDHQDVQRFRHQATPLPARWWRASIYPAAQPSRRIRRNPAASAQSCWPRSCSSSSGPAPRRKR